jgi:hypothetical protein
MMVASSQIIVLLLGTVVCGLSCWGMLVPDKLWKMVDGALSQGWGIYLAVIVRLILGGALLIVAPESRFPLVFEVLGWFAIVAAVAIVIMGRERLRRFVAWFKNTSTVALRVWLIFGAAFGLFLIYGVN